MYYWENVYSTTVGWDSGLWSQSWSRGVGVRGNFGYLESESESEFYKYPPGSLVVKYYLNLYFSYGCHMNDIYVVKC